MRVAPFAAWASGFCALLLTMGPADAAVKLCKPPVAGQPREAPNELQAKKLALDSWIAEVGKFGPNFVSWQLAINKKLACKASTDKSVRCQAVGQPCTISQTPLPKGVIGKPKSKGLDI
jgi:hypothetical protein